MRSVLTILTAGMAGAINLLQSVQAAPVTQLQGWFNLSQQWGGTVQSSNARYTEGKALPLRFTSTLAGGSTHTILLKYDFSTGGPERFFDSLASCDKTETNVNLLAGVSNPGEPSVWAIPTDSSLTNGAQLPGFITTYNISSLTFGSYSLVKGVKILPVTFTVVGTSSKNIVIGYAGHLASANIWGANNGASQFPGASTKAYASLDGASDLNVNVNPGSVVASADLFISKTASPEPVFSGDNLTYQLAVGNNGPNAAGSVTLTDALPPGATFISATTSQGTQVGSNPVSFSLGTLNVGATATMSIVAKVIQPTPGTLLNTAIVSSPTLDPNTTNNTASVSSTVKLKDTTPPVIACPSDLTTNTSPGQCTETVTFSVSATDDVQVATLICSPPSGSIFPKGSSTVNCLATDTSGNTAACSFQVNVLDRENPTIVCPPDLADVPTDPGQCYASGINLGAPPATNDNCAILTVTNDAPAQFPKGNTLVTWTVVDTSGNVASCQQSVTVHDHQAPSIVCPDNVIAPTDAGKCDAVISYANPTATDNCPGEIAVVCLPPSGSAFPIGTNLVVCAATDAAGNSSGCAFTVTVTDPPNQSWPDAMILNLADNLGVQQATVQQCLTTLDQSRWYKFKVQPTSRIVVTLTDLPENYDLVFYKDIAAAYNQLTSLDDLVHVTAEFASDAFSSSTLPGDAFAPNAFAPNAFAPNAFAPNAFAPNAFAPNAFAPNAFAPNAFAPDAFAPNAFAPNAFAPNAFAPDQYSPNAFAPNAFAPNAFAAAQSQSIVAVSAFDGTAGEGMFINTWDNDGYFYVRVRGRNGVFSLGSAFQLSVYMITGGCANVTSVPVDGSNNPLPASTYAAAPGNYKTIILTDLARLIGPGDTQQKTDLRNKLAALAARPEVGGVVVDVGEDSWVTFFNQQADVHYDCPFAKNLVAEAIKNVVDRSRAGNQLQYVVLVGNDKVIPFFRYPDEALLGPERNYVPPVLDPTPSQAGLRQNYVWSQDRYGARCSLSSHITDIPVPDLAVGRLVETALEIMGMIDAFLETTAGVASMPTTALVTGYDFLADDAQAVFDQFSLGIGTPPAALIAPYNQAPSLGWTADDLRAQLFGARHDLIFLAGHFSEAAALAADYTTQVLASELAGTAIDFKNVLIFSAGCHSGYNTVNGDAISGVTLYPDWPQACAQKQATLIAGTGYQYGDTDFIEYSERIYLDFAKQLRTGSDPVAVGTALKNAKLTYLATTPAMRGIHQKAYLEATLFGLPMFSINLPGPRLSTDVLTPVVTSTQPATVNPGLTLGLTFADVAITSQLTEKQVVLKNVSDDSQVIATYLEGGDGVVNNPVEPVLPLEVRNVSVPGTVLRGVGFRGGTYTDLLNRVPLTGAPTTEIRGVHAAFITDVFYPIRPWNVNYFGVVCGGLDGVTRLAVVPAQFISDSPTVPTGTIREFSEMDFRLFYSANITTYTDDLGNVSTPALAAAPSISAVAGITDAGGASVALSARVVDNPAAGNQEVWVTYTALSGPYAGRWQSLDLVQNASDSTLWEGALPLNGTPSQDVRFMVSAVSGVGVVAMDTKLGAYHIPDEFDAFGIVQGAPTAVQLISPPVSGAYGESANLSAQLLAEDGTPLSGQRMVFSIGTLVLWAITDANGEAAVTLRLRAVPDTYQAKAWFAGALGLAPSFASSPFTITRQSTALALDPGIGYVKPNVDTKIVATLTDGAGNRMVERTVFLVVTGDNGSYAVPVITDLIGNARLGPVPLPGGTYIVTAYFNGTIPLPGTTITLDDGLYLPSTATSPLILDGTPPQITCSPDLVQPTDPGRCDAVVTFNSTARDENPDVAVACVPASGAVFSKGTSTVNCTATDIAGNVNHCSFTVTVIDTQPPVIKCPGPIVASAEPGKCEATVSFAAQATDNCGATIAYDIGGTSISSPHTFPVGTTSVHAVARDDAQNTAECTFDVTVIDQEPPSIGCPGNITVQAGDQCSAVVTFSVPASDNCSGVQVAANPPSGSIFPTGTTTVKCTATDSSGNSSQCSFAVTVETSIACAANPLTMGFWQNKNGQGIITHSTGNGLRTFLRSFKPFQDFSSTASTSQIATYVANVIALANASGASMNALLKGQMLATALDVYFSDPSLGGNKINSGVPVGGVIANLTQVCQMIDSSNGTATCSGAYQNSSGAFGGAACLSVAQSLAYAASQSNSGGGTWYGNVKSTQELAKNTFDAVNNKVAVVGCSP